MSQFSRIQTFFEDHGLGLLLGICCGGGAALLFSWLVMVKPIQDTLSERERNLEKWAELTREEMDRIQTEREISTAELRSWVAANQEISTRFARIQQELHEQEVALLDPAKGYLIVVGGTVVCLSLVLAFLYRNNNEKANHTLESIVALAPPEMIRASTASYLAIKDVSERSTGRSTALIATNDADESGSTNSESSPRPRS